jgi:6-phosphogluconolactonase
MAADRMSVAAPMQIFDTAEALAAHVADWTVGLAQKAQPHFAVCLSGGSTPQRLYELLAAPARRTRLPWDRVHWFWGDERLVSHDDRRSNFGMARAVLLQQALVPAANVHFIPTDGPAAACAAAYEAELKRFYGAERLDVARPLFDLTLLGLGEDGHLASLFPNSPALDERTRWAVPVEEKAGVARISLTYPVLESSRVIAFLVTGERKREVLARLRAGERDLPASRLRPRGTVHWFADRAAAPSPALTGD